ncbi:NAD(P)/FAD-dependent oxidoreductase [Acuticoccus sediminis]|uniref:NAD(P)/FAD-dependent oxidoreductase n=1 Tax=Acuticoccus sediminis TaxID=2184697 RepID=UPI001CFC5298|nr:FAD-binding oxidoreductase [Acuticoccus sediminis]
MSAAPLRVAVIGGGVLGVSTAAHLAREGAAVTLVTEGALGSGASGRSLSWLNSGGSRSAAYHRLRMAGIDRYRTLAARNPLSASWLRFDGGLTWAVGGPDDAIVRAHAHERSLGYDSRLLTVEEVAATVPGVDPSAIAGPAIFNPGEGWVDLNALIDHLAASLRALGGTIVENAGPARLALTGGRISGVTAGDLALEADRVVVATGPAVPAMLSEYGVMIPDRTPISLLLRVAPLAHPLRAVLNTPRVSIRPAPDGGFSLDAGWSEKEVSLRADGTVAIPLSTVAGLLEAATRVLAGNPSLTLRSTGAGPKPIPGDGEPVLGELADLPGVTVAFSHSGATLGLVAGEMLAGEIVSGERHPMLETFRPGRFAAASAAAQ